MKKIDVGTIKGTAITNDLPEIMESINSSITDDSKEALTTATKKLSQANKELGKSLKQLNTYIDSMAEAFEEADKQASDMIKQNTVALSSTSKETSKGTNKYLNAI